MNAGGIRQALGRLRKALGRMGAGQEPWRVFTLDADGRIRDDGTVADRPFVGLTMDQLPETVREHAQAIWLGDKEFPL